VSLPEKRQITDFQKECFEREKDLRVLNEVAAEISANLELDDLLKKIAHDAIRITDSEGAVIALCDRENNSFSFSYVENLPKNLIKKDPRKGIAGVVIAKRRPVVLEDYSKAKEAIGEFAGAGIKGALAVPLMVKDKVYGVLGVIKFKPYMYAIREVQLLQSVAKQAAVAIENARLYGRLKEAYHKERYVAERLSRSLLPPVLPQIPNTELGVSYLSATPETYVGGDFYDYMTLENEVVFIVGDISGKGIDVASLTAMARNVLRTLIYQGYSPARLIGEANRIVYREVGEDFFIALSYYLYDWASGEIAFINAGQRHAYFCLDHISCDFVQTWQPALGLLPDYEYKENKLTVHKGDILTIYTDGLAEVRKSGHYFESELPGLILRESPNPAQVFTDNIMKELSRFNPQEELPDDVVMLVIKRIGD